MELDLSFSERALNYALHVLSGEVPGCKWLKAACQRFLHDIETAEARGLEYRPQQADRVCRFIELLPHVKGREWAGKKIRLQDWQAFILCNAFGWYWKATGFRRFRTIYIEVPRKNAKSTLSSGVALYMLTADEEEGAEVYSAATTRDQAAIVFGVAQQMAKREPGFRARWGVEVTSRAISVIQNASRFEALHAEGSTLDGLNVHLAVVDELHAHKKRDVWDVLETAMGARSQPMMWAITTAGSNRSGICWEQRSYVTRILNSVLRDAGGLGYEIKGECAEDDSYFGAIWTIDETDDWTSVDAWKKANPNYGISVYADDMARLCRKAQTMASARNNFLTKRLNVWVASDVAWLNMTAWEACGNRALDINDFEGEECFIGVDLAARVDIAAKARFFPARGERKRHALFVTFYLPEETVEQEGNEHYVQWVEDGRIKTNEGPVIDYSVIQEELIEDSKRFNVRSVGFDPFQAMHMMQALMDEGVDAVEMRPTVMNFSAPMKELEALVLQGRLEHEACPVMEWMVSNVVCHVDAKDNIYPRKDRAEAKIDGVVAAIMALGLFMRDEYDSESVYDEIARRRAAERGTVVAGVTTE